MARSRTTFATTDAAAMAALFSSPSTTARCGGAAGPRRNPSTRRSSASSPSAARAAASARRFERWRPERSISPAETTWTETLVAIRDDRPEEPFAEVRVELLRVVQQAERGRAPAAQLAVVEQDAGCDQGPREAAAARLVRPGDVPDAEPAIEGDQLAPAARRGHSPSISASGDGSCAAPRRNRVETPRRARDGLVRVDRLAEARPGLSGPASRGRGPSFRPCCAGSRASRGSRRRSSEPRSSRSSASAPGTCARRRRRRTACAR